MADKCDEKEASPIQREGRFELVAPYEAAGDQPKAIQEILEAFGGGERRATMLGATGTGKTFTMAKIVEALQKPTIVMAPNKTLAAQLYSEFRDFFPKNAVEYFVSYYDYYQPEAYVPAKDLFIEKDSSINEHIEQMRLSATKALLERNDTLVVATVSAIYGLGSPQSYHEMILSLRKGAKVNRKALFGKLVSMQYERTDMDFQRGSFRARGDCVDIFPSENSKEAVRVELFDDEIESIKLIDPLTGAVQEAVQRFNVYPRSHYAASEETMKAASKAIRAELDLRLAELKGAGKVVEFQRLETRTNFDLEMIQEIGFCKGIENYSRHLSGKKTGEPPDTLFDYLPKDALLILDESHVTIPQIGAMSKGDSSRKANLVDYGFRLPCALDNRPLRFEEFEKKMPTTLFVSATPGDYEGASSKSVVELVIRPTGILDPKVEVRSAQKQIDDLLREAKSVVADGGRVLVTCLTKKMAENVAEFLGENGVKARHLHSDIENIERVELLRDLRLGAFDVLVGINLLREGLDLPEVALVGILDADKEGFLRSARSLIQTIGRAARNPKGRVILYGDKVTDSMKRAMDETERRRATQEAWNQEKGWTPKIAKNEVKDLIDGVFGTTEKSKAQASAKAREGSVAVEEVAKLIANPGKLAKKIKELESKMRKAAEQLDFETAAQLRDQAIRLKEAAFR